MARTLHWIGLAALSLSLTGCVSQEKYNALKLANDDLTQRLSIADSDARASHETADALKNQLAQFQQNSGNYAGLITNLQQQNAELTTENVDLNKKLADALSRPVAVGSTALPAPLTTALTEFAQANADLVDFDAARGTVKFKSDVLFAPGSAELTSKAKEAVSRFATILDSSSANGYELMVCGHTDSTPVVNAETIKRGNLNNWYLSAHRAISVGTELIASHVSPQRIAVVGYAEQRPVATNASETGKAQNRRVEVLILPSTIRPGAPAVASTGVPAEGGRRHAAKSNPAANLNKDAAADPAPAIQRNK